jgi:hypothetical protein
MKNKATEYLLTRMSYGEDLKISVNGVKYDGVLQDIDYMGRGVCGTIYGNESSFEDGTFIETSEVVRVSNVLSSGWFIETLSGSRYLISSVNFNPTLSKSTESVEACMKDIQNYIKINESYFADKQWNNL